MSSTKLAFLALTISLWSCSQPQPVASGRQHSSANPESLRVALVSGAKALWTQERYEESLQLVDHSIALFGQKADLVELRCDLLFKLRRAHELLDATMLLEEISETKSPWNLLKIADAHIFLGNKEEALRWITRAVHERGFRKYKAFNRDYYDVIRDDPRFTALLEEMLEDRGIGLPARDFSVTLLDGNELTLSSLKGSVTLIDFWATWCAPCKKELPNLRQLYAEFHAQGFEIVSISLDQEEHLEKARAFIRENDLPWMLTLSGQGYDDHVAKLYQVNGLPSLWLIDRGGVLREQDIHGEELRTAVARLVDKG